MLFLYRVAELVACCLIHEKPAGRSHGCVSNFGGWVLRIIGWCYCKFAESETQDGLPFDNAFEQLTVVCRDDTSVKLLASNADVNYVTFFTHWMFTIYWRWFDRGVRAVKIIKPWTSGKLYLRVGLVGYYVIWLRFTVIDCDTSFCKSHKDTGRSKSNERRKIQHMRDACRNIFQHYSPLLWRLFPVCESSHTRWLKRCFLNGLFLIGRDCQ